MDLSPEASKNKTKSPRHFVKESSLITNEIDDFGDGISSCKNATLPNKDQCSSFSLSLEFHVEKLKINLEGWRYVIIPVRNVLLWEQQWHAGAIFGASTLLFFLLWIFDLSVLTTLSMMSLIIVLADYFVPTLSMSFAKPTAWNGVKQLQYDELCHTIVYYYYKIQATISMFYCMRMSRPKMFYGWAVPTLLFLAWVGNSINNLFLTYLMVTTLLMVPGLEHKGLLCKYGCLVTQKLSDIMASSKLTKKQE